MSIFISLLAAPLAFAPASAAVMPGAPVPPEAGANPLAGKDDESSRAVMLDTLFNELARARSPQESKAIEGAIFSIWMQSGSPSIDILMSHGLDAFAMKDYDRALFYFNEVVALRPGFVEGWDKRAAIFYLKDKYAEALKDLEHVLQLEPRHFSAMGGLAVILNELGDKRGALDVYRRALKLNPYLDGAAQAEKSLSIDVEGRGI
ncbi:MAG: tetratricopeptide repeat protein [Parvibaculum sp.]|uniref:tetratricopeptide repeat protein n=1 Tax=Parvibaculum sp. TaxID=2024848 RepID=UPI0028423EE6|nr:tetratricopeptide repeat protein [Parvibaculum sp.]MDR3499630.1 tetratricopeptide repeat protein [Parvibaculum sp.]